MAAPDAEVAADVVGKPLPPGLLDVMHVVSAHFPEEANIAVGICQEAWRDARIWMAIIDMKHKPKKADGKVDVEASRLVIASQRGRLDIVRRLLDLDANIEAKSASGNTALSLACRYGHEQVVSFLLDRHADIDALNVNTRSALHLACYWANVEVAKVLLARGANLDLGDPPILAACQGLHEDQPATMDMSTFWARRMQVVRLLVDHNANLNAVDTNGNSALMCAIRNNHVAIIEFLLDRHVDIDALNDDNESALCYACHWASVDSARLLLARGADVDLGNLPILLACQGLHEDQQAEVDMSTFWSRRLQVVRLMADHNANLNVADEDGWTAIMLASQNNQAAIIELLLDRHVDIDALSNDNSTVLLYACYYANVEAARLLLARGANINLGDPPILLACQGLDEDQQATMDMSTFWACRMQVVRLLVDHNANLDAVDANGNSALILGSLNNHVAIIEFLLDRHVDIDALNDDNESALCYACHWANVEAARLLLARGANVDLGSPPILLACQGLHEDQQAQVDMSTFWSRRCEIVIELVRHNADLDVVDAGGDGPLGLVEMNEQWVIVDVLREALGMSDEEEEEVKEEADEEEEEKEEEEV